MDNLVKWLRSNLDPRLRHSGTSSTGLFGAYLLIRKRAVLRYIIACWRFVFAFCQTYWYFNIVSNNVNKKTAKKFVNFLDAILVADNQMTTGLFLLKKLSRNIF